MFALMAAAGVLGVDAVADDQIGSCHRMHQQQQQLAALMRRKNNSAAAAASIQVQRCYHHSLLAERMVD